MYYKKKSGPIQETYVVSTPESGTKDSTIADASGGFGWLFWLLILSALFIFYWLFSQMASDG